MKKIAIVIAELGMPGGAEKVAADLALEFHRRDHEVVIVKFDQPLPGEVLHQLPCRIIDVKVPERTGGFLHQLWFLLQRAWRFHRVFQCEKFDHIFSFLEAANLPSVIASSKAVLSIHTNPGSMTRMEWFAIRWIYPRARRVIAISRQMQDLLMSKAKLKNTCCIYNPVDIRRIHEKSLQEIDIDERFIIAVGRLEIEKRFDLLLDAFAKSRTHRHCLLLIIGMGSEQSILEQQITELGLDGRVKLTGFDDNPYKYMARAEFQVMSSDTEGYPLVLIEALALGCPVVSTDCPTGPREIIVPGVNGLLVEKGNAVALAAGIDAVFFNPGLRERMSQQAAPSVQINDIAGVADRWLAT